MLVSIARYREITGDASTADELVSARIESAERLIGEWLGRELVAVERTEVVVVHSSGLAHPLGLPVVALGTDTPSGVRITDQGFSVTGLPSALTLAHDVVIEGSSDWRDRQLGTLATLTYTGGYTTESLPETLAYAIAEGVRWLGLRSAAAEAVPVGATSVRLGDAAVTYAEPHSGTVGATQLVQGAGLSAALRPYRHPEAA